LITTPFFPLIYYLMLHGLTCMAGHHQILGS